MTATILAKLATLLGRLHRSTSQITVPKPFVETFEVRFEAEMVRTCDMLVDGVPDENKGKRRLQESLLPRKGELLVHLGRLKELQQRVKRIEHTMVICHTDLHGENLMMDHQGHLHILDWENAILAPAEHDLMFLAGHESFWESFLPIYEREIGSARLNSDVLGFYYYRRDLEDLMDWIVRIMDSGGDEAQNAAGFREMVDCLDGLSEIEQKVGRIREGWRKYGGK